MPSSTITSVLPSARSISSTSPLIGTTVTLSGELMWYHTHSEPRFCATTTSAFGTQLTYDAYESSVLRDCRSMSYRCSCRRLSRKRSLVALSERSSQSMRASCEIVAALIPESRSSTRIVCRSIR